MGAVIFALTDTVETAADLAARSGGKPELVQLLRAVEGKEMICGDVTCYAVCLSCKKRLCDKPNVVKVDRCVT